MNSKLLLLFTLVVFCNAVQGRKYVVKVQTGDKYFAGTDAKVWIKLIGTKGETEEIQLGESSALKCGPSKDCFELGNRPDEFEIEGKDIGILTQVKLKRDDGNGDDDWYVEWVEVKPFPKVGFHNWLKTFKWYTKRTPSAPGRFGDN